jgi:hypothetical protein
MPNRGNSHHAQTASSAHNASAAPAADARSLSRDRTQKLATTNGSIAGSTMPSVYTRASTSRPRNTPNTIEAPRLRNE